MNKCIVIVALAFLPCNELLAQSFANPEMNPFELARAGPNSSPALVEIDGDGDLDVVSGYLPGWFGFFENKGSGAFILFQPLEENPWGLTELSNNSTPFFADLDADGDMDLLCGSTEGLVYFENTGTSTGPGFGAPQDTPFSIMPPQGIIKPYMVDIDGDGDLDLFVGATNGSTYFFENIGQPDSAAFANPVKDPFGLKDVGNGAAPAFGDVDGDGDADAVIGESDNGDLYYFENTGTATTPDFDSVGPNQIGLQPVDAAATPYFGDLNADGKPDILCGNANGDFYYFKNTTAVGVNDPQLADISIYPNPANHHIQITAAVRIVKVEVFNSVGIEAAAFTTDERTVTLDIEKWQRGFYILQVSLPDGATVSRRLIVAHNLRN